MISSIVNYDNKRFYKAQLNYNYFELNKIGSKIRDTLKEIEENQSFLIVYTVNEEINEFNEPLGYYLYNTRIIITPMAIKKKKEITKSLVQLIRNSKFDEDSQVVINEEGNNDDIEINNDGVILATETRCDESVSRMSK